jgi:mRNA interferase YafQ
MRYTIIRVRAFKKDQKRIVKRCYDHEKLTSVVRMLADGYPLPIRYRPHKLTGNYKGCWECHIEPDWLLIYFYAGDCLHLVRTGTHADLFEK